MSEQELRSFEEFWPYYVGAHRDPVCRACHYVGTGLALGTVAAAVVTWNPAWLLLTPVVGYGPAWFGHFIIEGNVPATFDHPLWSLRGDLRMFRMALQGKMAAEVERLYPAEDDIVPAEKKETPRAPKVTQPHTNGANPA